ncbi:MAG: DUF3422 domain-containing protein [Betaproteobacteria bacterium]|nr:DUF3422 domain-containing protein [Betaproteobacteria bacterium]
MLPREHTARIDLAHEVHARPYEVLETPVRSSFVALLCPLEARPAEIACFAELCAGFGLDPPPADASHFRAEFGGANIRWERHTEFSTFAVYASSDGLRPFSTTALALLPEGWLSALPGELVFAAHAELLRGEYAGADPGAHSALFAGNDLVGSEVGEGAAMVITDFRVHADGFSRFLVFDRSLTRGQAGRLLHRLFEIEAYRMMALLALPGARAAMAALAGLEMRLAAIMSKIAEQSGADEPLLLDALTRVAAEVENLIASNQSRFRAARAYHGIVRSRIGDLRERRIKGLQTIDEFMARRLAPAMDTCESALLREVELSERVARASGLLSTRVDIVRERQNQQLLESMDRRARLRLRLQETVEGLSVVAITYYLVGLVGHAAKGFEAAGWAVDAEIVMAASIPLIAVLAALGIRYVRRVIVGSQGAVAGRNYY